MKLTIDWRVVAISGAAAFLLSALTGIIAGVGLGVLFGRALLWGGVFAILTQGAWIVIQSFLPELVTAPGSEVTETPAAEPTVDITIEGEEPFPAMAKDQSSQISQLESVEEEGGVETLLQVDDQEEPQSTPVGEVPAAMVEEVTEQHPAVTSMGNGEAVDVLPDLENFSDSFENVTSVSGGEGISHEGVQSVNILGKAHSTDDIVQAVKTVMKKDQEG
ncbi:MAG: hypothetical protein KAU17_00095 [Spirochaetales bacterium]|nr:hypothetical protein [Spirochaetales bacterium]